MKEWNYSKTSQQHPEKINNGNMLTQVVPYRGEEKARYSAEGEYANLFLRVFAEAREKLY